MFGWLKGKPKCAVTDEVRAWVDGRVSWLAKQFGTQRLRCEMILPDSRFFPDAYRPTEEGARGLFAHVCRFLSIAPERIDLRFFKVADHRAMSPQDWWRNTPGLRQNRAGREIIQVEEGNFQDPLALVAIFAHELSHVILLGENRLTGEEEDLEPLTDLAAAALGFGVFMANAAYQSHTALRLRTTETLGYMGDPCHLYALAVLSFLRYQGAPPWAKLIRDGIRSPMLETIRWLAEIDPQTDQPRPAI